MIQELHSSQIDKIKWDLFVNADEKGKVYTSSWYLDAVTNNNWKALVLGDYEVVLPFVSNKKLGISYCYMPYFVQQFSVGKDSINPAVLIGQLRKSYPYGQLAFAEDIIGLEGDIETEQRNNFELSLNHHYEILKQAFSSNHKTNINRFKRANCNISRSEEIADLITLLQDEKSAVFHAKEMEGVMLNIKRIHEAAVKRGADRLYYATDASGIVGGAFFVEHGNRLYYLLGTAKRKLSNSPSVSYGLLEHVIQEYAGRPMILDFEGSQIESISYFFKGFGAANHPYWMLKWNDLPFFVKWIKK